MEYLTIIKRTGRERKRREKQSNKRQERKMNSFFSTARPGPLPVMANPSTPFYGSPGFATGGASPFPARGVGSLPSFPETQSQGIPTMGNMKYHTNYPVVHEYKTAKEGEETYKGEEPLEYQLVFVRRNTRLEKMQQDLYSVDTISKVNRILYQDAISNTNKFELARDILKTWNLHGVISVYKPREDNSRSGPNAEDRYSPSARGIVNVVVRNQARCLNYWVPNPYGNTTRITQKYITLFLLLKKIPISEAERGVYNQKREERIQRKPTLKQKIRHTLKKNSSQPLTEGPVVDALAATNNIVVDPKMIDAINQKLKSKGIKRDTRERLEDAIGLFSRLTLIGSAQLLYFIQPKQIAKSEPNELFEQLSIYLQSQNIQFPMPSPDSKEQRDAIMYDHLYGVMEDWKKKMRSDDMDVFVKLPESSENARKIADLFLSIGQVLNDKKPDPTEANELSELIFGYMVRNKIRIEAIDVFLFLPLLLFPYQDGIQKGDLKNFHANQIVNAYLEATKPEDDSSDQIDLTNQDDSSEPPRRRRKISVPISKTALKVASVFKKHAADSDDDEEDDFPTKKTKNDDKNTHLGVKMCWAFVPYASATDNHPPFHLYSNGVEGWVGEYLYVGKSHWIASRQLNDEVDGIVHSVVFPKTPGEGMTRISHIQHIHVDLFV
jgi:hypothetical protein